MNTNVKRRSFIVCGVCVGVALVNYAVLFAVTELLPDLVPVHVNWALYADRMGSVLEIRLFPLISVVFPIIAAVGIYFTKPDSQNLKIISIVIIGVCMLLLCTSWMCVYIAFQYKSVAEGNPVSALMLVFILIPLALIFIALGNYSALIKPNKWLGVRTASTFSDETVWHKTHRFAGFCGVGAGVFLILMTVVTIFTQNTIAAFVGIGGAVLLLVVPIFYARYLVKRSVGR